MDEKRKETHPEWTRDAERKVQKQRGKRNAENKEKTDVVEGVFLRWPRLPGREDEEKKKILSVSLTTCLNSAFTSSSSSAKQAIAKHREVYVHQTKTATVWSGDLHLLRPVWRRRKNRSGLMVFLRLYIHTPGQTE